MANADFLNEQIKDSVEYTNHTVLGHAPSHSTSMLDALMAETIGMAMYNAVNTQHNAQLVSSAAVTATCAKMLKVPSMPWLAQPLAAVIPPIVTSVAPVAGTTPTFLVTGAGFAPGLSVEIFENGLLTGTVSGKSITNITPASFDMETRTRILKCRGVQVF